MATRKEIAALAGVSVSVVSRAVNNSGYVERQKKEKILQIAKELHYHPNPVAMSLQSRRTRQFLFYCKDLQNAFNIELYQGMMEAAKEKGYMAVINGTLEFDNLKDAMIDGIIMPNENATEFYQKTIGKNYYLPFVTASYGNPVILEKSVTKVEIDLYQATQMAIAYLRKKGHTRIAFGTPYGYDAKSARMFAYLNEMKPVLKAEIRKYVLGIDKKDLGSDERLARFAEETQSARPRTEEDFFGKGEIAAQLMLERQIDATAILCFNDEFAFGVCNQFRRMGIHVPEQISVMGIDGAYTRRYTQPLLTTVNLFPKKQGKKCAELLIDLIEGKKVKHVVYLPTEILEGESVKNICE